MVGPDTITTVEGPRCRLSLLPEADVPDVGEQSSSSKSRLHLILLARTAARVVMLATQPAGSAAAEAISRTVSETVGRTNTQSQQRLAISLAISLAMQAKFLTPASTNDIRKC
jgi:hypothetical protein